jgi:predicted dehydrogenase
VIRKREGTIADGQLPVQIEEQSFDQGDALLAEIRAFIAAIRGERKIVVTATDGLRALRTAIAITERVQGHS